MDSRKRTGKDKNGVVFPIAPVKKKEFEVLTIAAAAAAGFMALGWSFFDMTVRCKKNRKQIKKQWFSLSHAKINHPRHKFEKEYEEGVAWFKAQPLQDCYLRSRDGLRLHASYLPAENAERIVLLSHGYKGSGYGDFAYTAQFLHEHHCSLLLINQRCCGESEGEYITFGAKEQQDVQDWTWYLAKRNKNKLPIYLYGESMGASSILMASGHPLPREVKGLIADCGFSSMKKQMQDMAANWFHLKWIGLLLLRLELFCRIFAGFSMKEADTAEALKKNERPVLFFHGMKDTYVMPENTMHNYSLCSAPKELVLVPEARHLCSAYEAPELYRSKLLEFFQKYDGMPA